MTETQRIIEPTVRTASFILVTLNVMLWGCLVLLGVLYAWTVYQNIAPASPNVAQITLWLVGPIAIWSLSLVRPILRLRAGEQNLGVGVLGATLALWPLYAVTFAVGA